MVVQNLVKRTETKFFRLKDELLKFIRKSKAGEMLPSNDQLEKTYKISRTTIEKAIQELLVAAFIERRAPGEYMVSANAKEKVVALVFADHMLEMQATPFYKLLLMNLQNCGKAFGFKTQNFMNVPSSSVPEGANISLRQLHESNQIGRIDAMIVGNPLKEMEWYEQFGVPVVRWLSTGVPGRSDVTMEWAQLLKLGLNALVARGCRRIAFFTPVWHESVLPTLEEGFFARFRKYLGQRGLECHEHLICRTTIASDRIRGVSFEEYGRMCLRSVMEACNSAEDQPDGLLITDDVLALGILQDLKYHGYTLGKQVQVATHANKGSPTLRAYEDKIIRLEVDSYEVAQALYYKLETLRSGTASDEPIYLGFNLVEPG